MYNAIAHHPHQMTHMAASGLASLGRNDDKMLVHMTPQEVGGLRHLAMAAGGDLTINPHTGLPEAGFLSKLLPMIAGVALAPFTGGLSLFGSQALADAAIVGGADTAITGSWKKGLMAGLGAYGGASLGAGIMGAGAGTVAGAGITPASTTFDSLVPNLATAPASPTFDSLVTAGSTPFTANPFDSLVTAGSTPLLTAAPLTNAVTAAEGAFAPSTANPGGLGGISQFGTGLENSFGSTSGMKGLWSGLSTPAKASLGMTGLSAMTPDGSSNIPGATGSPSGFYNTTYDPKTMKFGKGYWTKDFVGRDYTGVPGKGQVANAAGPMGSYADPYTSMVEEGLVSARAGGAIKHMASGGDTSTADKSAPSNLEAYAASLSAPSAASNPFTATAENTAANNAYMASLGAGTAPNLPPGAKDAPFITSAYVPPPPPPAKTPATGAGFTGLSSIGNALSGGNTFGLNALGCVGGLGGGSTYSYDPITGKFTQSAAPGMGGGGGGGGKAAGGGIGSLNSFAGGGTTLGSYSDGGRLLKGPGDGMSDSIPAHIHGEKPQPAALADGEFVVPADVVSHLGNGSTEAGSKQLYKMMDKVRRARTGNPKQGRQINPEQFIPA